MKSHAILRCSVCTFTGNSIEDEVNRNEECGSVAQGFDRIDVGGAACGNGAGNDGDEAEQQCDAEKDERIARAALGPVGEDSAERDGEDKTCADAAAEADGSRFVDNAEDVAALRSEGHANAELAGAL